MHPLLRHKTLFLDLDGTMYRGDEVIPGAPLFIEALHTLQIPYYFLTNNAMRTHAQNREKMEAMGFQGLRDAQYFTSAAWRLFSHRKRCYGAYAGILQ